MKTSFLNIFFITILVFVIFANVIQFYNISPTITTEITIPNFHFSENSTFSWPLPGFYNITSNFGTRTHPISGKISSHQGIDISGTVGADIYSAYSGIVTLAEYNGANGYSIHISNGSFEFVYGHVSPCYIVSVGDKVEQNQIIGNVGPKYVDGKLNGSTTGPHLHFGIKKDGIAVNPLDFI